jgi:hypothetical protein
VAPAEIFAESDRVSNQTFFLLSHFQTKANISFGPGQQKKFYDNITMHNKIFESINAAGPRYSRRLRNIPRISKPQITRNSCF